MAKEALVVRSSDRELFDLLGVGIRFVCGADETGRAWSLMENIVPKHTGAPPHYHPWDEAYYVVEGEVDFTVDGRSERVRAGDFIYAPADVVHAYSGVSDEPARLLIFDVPAHAEALFRELHEKVAELPRDLPIMAEIGGRHGISFVR